MRLDLLYGGGAIIEAALAIGTVVNDGELRSDSTLSVRNCLANNSFFLDPPEKHTGGGGGGGAWNPK